MERLLVLLALFKIQRILAEGLRFRTACDLDIVNLRVTRPASFDMPSLADIEDELTSLIDRIGDSGRFGDTRVLTVTYKK